MARRRLTVLPTPADRTFRRRVLRWLRRAGIGLLVLVVLAAAISGFVLATETGSEWAVRRIVQSIDEGIPGSIEFDYAGGTLLDGIRLRNVVIRDPAGYEVVRVAEASAGIELLQLFDLVAHFTDVRFRGVDVTVRQRKEWLGIVRAFRVDEPEAVAALRPPGEWLFELPDIRIEGLRVKVDLPSTALDVSVPELEVSLQAGRGSHDVRATVAGRVDLKRAGSTPRADRVAFSGRIESRTERPVGVELRLEQFGDTINVDFALDDGILHAAVRDDGSGVDLDRYLVPGSHGIRPGRARDVAVGAHGPLDDLAFRLAARTDAGAVRIEGRLTGEDSARVITAQVHVDDALPVRLGAADAPPGLAVSLDADLRVVPAAPSVEAELAALEITGVHVPAGPWSGHVRADRTGGSARLVSDDGAVSLAAAIEPVEEAPGGWHGRVVANLAAGARLETPWGTVTGPIELAASGLAAPGPEGTLPGSWSGEAEAKLAAAARMETPWFTAVGPIELVGNAEGDSDGVDEGGVTLASRGEVRVGAGTTSLSGPWSTRLDARPGEAGWWTADGWLLGEEGAELQAGGVRVSGPVERSAGAPDEASGVPVHVELGPDGSVRLHLEDARIAAVEDPARGARTTAPVVADLSLSRAANGELAIAAAIGSDGTLVLGREDSVSGPFLASAEATSADGEWRLVRATVDAAGARHGKVRAGAIHADVEPTAWGDDSRLSASVTGLRSGQTRIGSLTVELVGDTVSGGGTVRLASGGSTASSSVRLRRSVQTGVVEASFDGGLLRSQDSAIRFRGTVRAGPSGFEIPAIVLEGSGASGRVAGAIPDWRRLRVAAELNGLPLDALFDFGLVPPELHDVVEAGRISGRLDATGTLQRPVVEFAAVVDGLATGGVRETRVTAEGRLEGDELRVSAEATLASGGAVVADLTQLPASGLTVFVRADRIPLSLLRTVRPDLPAVGGTLSEGSVLFVADEHAIEVRVGVEDFVVGGLPPIDGWIDIDCRGRECRDRFRIQLPEDGVAEGDGRVVLFHDPTLAPALALAGLRDGDWLQHVAFAEVDPAAFGPIAEGAPSGSLTGSAVLTGRPGSPSGRAEVVATGLSWEARPGLPPFDARATVDADAAGVRVGLHLADPSGGAAEAVVEWPSDPLTLLQDLEAAATPDVRLAGTVAGDVFVALFPGSFAHAPAERVGIRTRWSPPAGDHPSVWFFSVAGDSPFLGDVPARAFALAIDGEGRRADLRATVRNDEGVALQVRGNLVLPDQRVVKWRDGREPVSERRPPPAVEVPDGAFRPVAGVESREAVPEEEAGDAFPDLLSFGRLDAADVVIDATIYARGLDLGGVPAPTQISSMTGLADLDLIVRGPLSSPDVVGAFHIVEGGFVLVATAQRFTHVELTGAIAPGMITLERVAAESGGGEASLSGTIDTSVPGRFDVELRLDSDEFPLSGEGATFGRLTCEAGVSGAVSTEIEPRTGARRVDAGIEVGRCTLVLPRQRAQAVMGMGDHPDFVVVGQEALRPTAASESAAPWDVTVRLDAEGELSLRREDMQMTVTGTMVFSSGPSAGGGSYVSGSLEMRRGWADMFGRRFDLEFGTVEFTGHQPVDGAIDIRLAAPTAEGTVYVDVTGTLRHPAVQLTSDPPRDQSEILALLFLGRTDATSEEQLALGGQAGQVAGNVVDAVGLAFFQSEVASRISPLTVLRVDPGSSGFADARLRAGMNVLSSLYVEYVYQIAADDVQNSNEGRVEWLILRNLSLEGNFGDAQSGGIHLQFRTEW